MSVLCLSSLRVDRFLHFYGYLGVPQSRDGFDECGCDPVAASSDPFWLNEAHFLTRLARDNLLFTTQMAFPKLAKVQKIWTQDCEDPDHLTLPACFNPCWQDIVVDGQSRLVVCLRAICQRGGKPHNDVGVDQKVLNMG